MKTAISGIDREPYRGLSEIACRARTAESSWDKCSEEEIVLVCTSNSSTIGTDAPDNVVIGPSLSARS